MRHNRKINHLGRKSDHRKALLANMANSLILHKRINTTTAKAKALKVYVEPLITKAKNDTTHSRRVVFSYLKSKTAVSELFRDVAEKVGDRPGGYTRILKTGNRLGDNAEMCMIELVDFNENMLAAKETKTKSRRSRRGSSKKAEAAAAPVKAEAAKEAPKAEEAEEVQAVTEESVTDEPQAAEPEAEATEPEAEKEEPKAE
ncbi:MAG: 50S ribosomal protein L17 [Mangrovibacterium sp.]